jgi:hypothetical protein
VSNRFVRYSLSLTFAVALTSAQSRPIPQLVKQDGKFRLMVEGNRSSCWAARWVTVTPIPIPWSGPGPASRP